jgi:hypothetical protein
MPDEIIREALEQFRFSEDGSADMRARALEDIRFARMSDQWPEDVKRQRHLEGRPCLTINRLPSFIRQVVNDARQNKPSIAVHPIDGGADFATAQIIGGLIRSIERGSNAALAYDTAIDSSVSCGFGFFRITTDYCHPDSFDQELRIERVMNPFSVHWDTGGTQFDASDWSYAFVSEMLTKEEFKRRYPKAKSDPSDWPDGTGEGLEDWTEEDRVRVAEYWRREEKTRKIVRLSDGRVLRADKLAEPIDLGDGRRVALKDMLAAEGVTINGEREAAYHEVTRRMMSGVEVLSEEAWPGSMIPVIPVWGEEVVYRGKRHFRSLIRDAKDPQAMMNFWRSASTELVALAPRAPWIGPQGFIPTGQGHAEKWASANTRSHAFLEYDPSAGPMPQRQSFAGVPAGALQEALNAQDDMKSVMGIFDASLGARSNETSGRAINARQREADKGTFQFIDNMARAIQYAGRVLIECIPSIYSERQTIQILGDDEAEKVVRLKQARGVPPSPEDMDGKIYDLSTGKYDVTVKVGPNYATQREEGLERLTQIMQAAPETAAILGDLAVSNMDFPGADKAARRLRAMLPPQIAAIEQEDGQGNIPPEARMMLAQAQQQAQQMQAQLQQMAGEMQRLQAGEQAKAGELQVKGQEVVIKGQELQLKARELELKAAEQSASIAANNAAVMTETATLDTLRMLADAQAQAARQLAAGQAQLGEALAVLSAAAVAPKRLVRDGEGRPVGVEVAV